MPRKHRRPSARTGAIVAAAAVLLALYAAGTFSAPPLPGDQLGWRRFRTPALEGELRLGERFRMNGDGLTAIEIRAVATGDIQGRIRLELQRWNGVAGTVIRSAEVEAADLVRSDSYRFAFAPVPDSLGGSYQLEVSSSADAPSRGVALWATKGERFRDGWLIVNGVERWADLAFEVEATAPPRPPAWVNVRHPLVLFTYGGLALTWIGVAYALRQLARYDGTVAKLRLKPPSGSADLCY